jgi:hypothetical protein
MNVNINVNVPSFEEAQEREILDVMRPWPGQMEARLASAGYENFAGGDRVLQEYFELKLRNPDDPDTLACIKWLAEQGTHRRRRRSASLRLQCSRTPSATFRLPSVAT